MFGPSCHALKFLLRLRGMPTIPPSSARVSLCVRRYRAEHSDRAAWSLLVLVEVRPIGDCEQLRACADGVANWLCRDDLVGQSAEYRHCDGTRKDQPSGTRHEARSRLPGARRHWMRCGLITYHYDRSCSLTKGCPESRSRNHRDNDEYQLRPPREASCPKVRVVYVRGDERRRGFVRIWISRCTQEASERPMSPGKSSINLGRCAPSSGRRRP